MNTINIWTVRYSFNISTIQPIDTSRSQVQRWMARSLTSKWIVSYGLWLYWFTAAYVLDRIHKCFGRQFISGWMILLQMITLTVKCKINLWRYKIMFDLSAISGNQDGENWNSTALKTMNFAAAHLVTHSARASAVIVLNLNCNLSFWRVRTMYVQC